MFSDYLFMAFAISRLEVYVSYLVYQIFTVQTPNLIICPIVLFSNQCKWIWFNILFLFQLSYTLRINVILSLTQEST